MLSEGVHSLVDAGTELVLLYALAASQRPPSQRHQLGSGRELFFWNFVVALLILALGAGVALLDGVRQVLSPRPVDTSVLSYGVLVAALGVELVTWLAALKRANLLKGERTLWAFLRQTRDATTLTLLLGGAASIAGVVIAAMGMLAADELRWPGADGVASAGIAGILAVTAFVLAYESKELLVGVSADPAVVHSILKVAADDPSIERINGSLTVHLAPDQILVALSVAFRPDLTTRELEQAIGALEARLKLAHREIVALFVEPQSPERFAILHPGNSAVRT